MMPTASAIHLKSWDGQIYEISRSAAELSGLIQDSLPEQDDEDDDDDGDDRMETNEPIELIRVGGQCLGKVVEFLNHYDQEKLEEIPCPIVGHKFEEIIRQPWYQNFCSEDNMPRAMLFEVLRAANYMNIGPLLDLTCLKLTFQIQGKSAEEIREMLNLPALTPEEERRAREDHAWLFDNK